MSAAPLHEVMIEPLVRAALLEDLGRAGDITTDAIVPPTAMRPWCWPRASRAWSPVSTLPRWPFV